MFLESLRTRGETSSESNGWLCVAESLFHCIFHLNTRVFTQPTFSFSELDFAFVIPLFSGFHSIQKTTRETSSKTKVDFGWRKPDFSTFFIRKLEFLSPRPHFSGGWYLHCDFFLLCVSQNLENWRRNLIRKQRLTLGGRKLKWVRFFTRILEFLHPPPYYSWGRILPLWFFSFSRFKKYSECEANTYPKGMFDFGLHEHDLFAFFTWQLEFLPTRPSIPHGNISPFWFLWSLFINPSREWLAKPDLAAKVDLVWQKAVFSAFVTRNLEISPSPPIFSWGEMFTLSFFQFRRLEQNNKWDAKTLSESERLLWRAETGF